MRTLTPEIYISPAHPLFFSCFLANFPPERSFKHSTVPTLRCLPLSINLKYTIVFSIPNKKQSIMIEASASIGSYFCLIPC